MSKEFDFEAAAKQQFVAQGVACDESKKVVEVVVSAVWRNGRRRRKNKNKLSQDEVER